MAETKEKLFDEDEIRNRVLTQAFDFDGRRLDATSAPEIPDNELLAQAAGVASEMMTGEVPDDVRREIERITAEMSTQGGVGPSQFASNITAQTLGLTSLDLKRSGAELGTQVAAGQLGFEDLKYRVGMFNREMDHKWSTLAETVREWDQQYAATMRELDIREVAVQLEGLALVSENQMHMDEILSQLIIANAMSPIGNVEGNMESIRTGVMDTNRFINDFIMGAFD